MWRDGIGLNEIDRFSFLKGISRHGAFALHNPNEYHWRYSAGCTGNLYADDIPYKS